MKGQSKGRGRLGPGSPGRFGKMAYGDSDDSDDGGPARAKAKPRAPPPPPAAAASPGNAKPRGGFAQFMAARNAKTPQYE